MAFYYLQRLHHNVALLVHDLEILAHVPNVTGDERLELSTQVNEGAVKLRLVLRLYFLFLAIADDAVDKLLWNREVFKVSVELRILRLELLAM